MPLHDWTQVEAGIFHAFHTTWIAEIQNSLNDGLLPPRFYALAEHARFKQPLPEMPLFLTAERYINVPLEPTYQAAWHGMPRFWKDVLDGTD